jgi:DNA-binding transcriptional ArsR family regulator
MTTYQKTEKLLKNYRLLQMGEQSKRTRRTVERINRAISDISDDKYIQIIKMYYFENQKVEAVAMALNLSQSTVYYHRERLVEMLAVILFADDFIEEILKD